MGGGTGGPSHESHPDDSLSALLAASISTSKQATLTHFGTLECNSKALANVRAISQRLTARSAEKSLWAPGWAWAPE